MTEIPPPHLPAPEQATADLPFVLRDAAPRITVVGDVMLDGWWIGRVERMSREAPTAVVEIEERRFAPGGAANTAVNLAALGARVRVVGTVGDDEAGHRLRERLDAAGVDTAGLLTSPGSATVTKTRIVSGDQILLRVDDTPPPGLPVELQASLAGAVTAALADADALLVCDYGAEALLQPVQEALARTARPPLVVVDAHDPAPWSAIRPDLVTPNAAEAFRLLGRAVPQGQERVTALASAGPELRRRSGAGAVLVTLDRDGAVLLGDDGLALRTAARPTPEKQAAGAGDTFVAALTLARAGGLPLPVAVQLAQAAADVVVQRFGTSTCSTEELAERLGHQDPPVLDEEALARRVAADRAAGRRIVLTNGCFDVLHRGHTGYLAQAARLGDVLVVAVNSDASVRRLKGPERPINTAADRAGVLAALSCVSYVTVFDTDTPIPLVERLRPDVYAKGGDYSPDMLAEAAVVRAYGGEVQILDYVPSQSTTEVVGRIRAGLGRGEG